MSLSLRPTRTSDSLGARLFLALGIFLLLQPGLFAVLGTSGTPVVTPSHQHVSAGPVPAHQHWYDTRDESQVPPGCGPNHHDHRTSGPGDAGVVCVPGDHVVGEHGTSTLLGADGLILSRSALEQQISLFPPIMLASWNGRPTTPPPQFAL